VEPQKSHSPDPAWTDEEQASLRLWISLARCYSTFSRRVAAWVQVEGLTQPQFGVLEALHHLGPLQLGELADKLLVTGGNVTYVMDRLEEQGLVERDRSGPDRRVVTARLTRAGTVLIKEMFPDHASFIHELTDVLSDEERAELRRLLKKLGKGISEEG
jgi:MarR family transcriptional regulator, 2-MHQ and catechol-resistance regulon repressor